MVNPIIITNEETNEEFTLEFNRDSVKYAEEHGFTREDVGTKLMTRVPQLFYFAFRMHHPRMTQAQTDKILFDDLGGMSETLANRLIDLFQAPYETLLCEEDTPKNPKVSVKL